MKLVVGLGNPILRPIRLTLRVALGKVEVRQAQDKGKYSGTRHNLGFAVLDEFARKGTMYNVQFTIDNKLKAEILKTPGFILAKPQTYMNNSGMAVKLLASYYKIAPEDIIIIHDELDLPLGKIKVRVGGSAAGHHGVESIIESLEDDKFTRVRLGIGNLHTQRSERDRQHVDVEHFVLEPFEPVEKAKVKHMIKQAVKALEILLDKGEEAAQNQYN